MLDDKVILYARQHASFRMKRVNARITRKMLPFCSKWLNLRTIILSFIILQRSSTCSTIFFLLCRRKSVLWEKWQGTSRMRWCGKCFTWVVTWLCLVWQMFPRSFGLETDLLLEKSYNEKNGAAVEYVYFSSGSNSTLASDGRWKGNWSVFIRTGKRKLGNMASSNNHDFDE